VLGEVLLGQVRNRLADLLQRNLRPEVTDAVTVVIWTEDGFVDLVKNPGQFHFVTLAEIYRPFVNQAKKEVVDFERPRRRIEVVPGRLGGFPTIVGTRVPYDTVAKLQRGPSGVRPEDVKRFFPGVTKAAALDAVNFADEVQQAATA
jgi:uncharacterized protein (DUF433 family)